MLGSLVKKGGFARLSSFTRGSSPLMIFDSGFDLLTSPGFDCGFLLFLIVSCCFLRLSGMWGLPLRAYNLAWESNRTCGMRLQGGMGTGSTY